MVLKTCSCNSSISCLNELVYYRSQSREIIRLVASVCPSIHLGLWGLQMVRKKSTDRQAQEWQLYLCELSAAGCTFVQKTLVGCTPESGWQWGAQWTKLNDNYLCTPPVDFRPHKSVCTPSVPKLRPLHPTKLTSGKLPNVLSPSFAVQTYLLLGFDIAAQTIQNTLYGLRQNFL